MDNSFWRVNISSVDVAACERRLRGDWQSGPRGEGASALHDRMLAACLHRPTLWCPVRAQNTHTNAARTHTRPGSRAMFPFVSETNYLVIKARATNELYHRESRGGGMLHGKRQGSQRSRVCQQCLDGPHASRTVVGMLLRGPQKRMKWKGRGHD